MRSIATILIAIALPLTLAAGCGKNTDEAAPPSAPPATATAKTTTTTTVSADPKVKADQIYQQRCVACHGEKGMGDGPASAGLDPKPRNFGDPSWQESVDDVYIQKIIQYGGTAVGKSAAMPANPDLRDEAVIAALKDVVRRLGTN